MGDFSCHICNTVEKPLTQQIIQNEDGDNQEVWICSKHLFMQILDAGAKMMQENMPEYTGALFSYKDDFGK